jgi:hypothetical protein
MGKAYLEIRIAFNSDTPAEPDYGRLAYPALFCQLGNIVINDFFRFRDDIVRSLAFRLGKFGKTFSDGKKNTVQKNSLHKGVSPKLKLALKTRLSPL